MSKVSIFKLQVGKMLFGQITGGQSIVSPKIFHRYKLRQMHNMSLRFNSKVL